MKRYRHQFPTGVGRSIGIASGVGLLAVLLVSACHDLTAPLPMAATKDLIPGAPITVHPGDMQGWQFYNDQRDTVCANAAKCSMVAGPSGPPVGSGSAELATQVDTDGVALLYAGYGGTRFDSITTLTYSTYRQSQDPGNNLAIALQLNVDYDLNDSTNSYQGRLVYEPYQTSGGAVNQGVWQTWDSKAGRWWGSKSSVPSSGIMHANPCVQATPCTWDQLLAAFPNLGIHRTYGAIVLKAGSGWPSFRGNVDALQLGVAGVVTTFDFELSAPPQVSITPPDSVPAWIYADTNLVDGADVIAGKLAKNAVLIAFDSDATSATRSAALSRVHGSVVGGVPLSPELGGFYYVQVNAATPSAALAVVDSLASAAGVALALPVMSDSLAGDYRRPTDGPAATEWQVNPAKADGDNWALESIGAPMAWGCSTGSSDTRIAVVDAHFHDVSDLHDNVVGLTHYVPASDLDRHGLAVASIIGATGNNQQGSTGVMWSAALQLYDSDLLNFVSRDGLLTSTARMAEAVVGGARVINVSAHLMALGNTSPVIPATPAGQAYLDHRVLPALRWVLRVRNGSPSAPLFVFSAGNGDLTGTGRDAKWNGFPVIEAEFPSRVLVVAATQADSAHRHLRSDSNFGSLVQIAAPGTRVMALNQSNQTAPFNQTSAATPLVSGVAGLLASFDPALTTSQIRDFIVAGALQGGQYSDGIPYLNAYESLKLAASRVGAPLCGNRLWNDGSGHIVVERGSATETIIQRDPNDYTAFVHAYHGGRRVDLGFSYEYDWSAQHRSFEEVSYTDAPFSDYGGAWLSYAYVADHDNQFYSSRVDALDAAGGQRSSVQLLSNGGSLLNDLGSQHIPGTTTGPPAQICTELFPRTVDGDARMVIAADEFAGTYDCVDEEPFGAWDSAPTTRASQGLTSPVPLLASVAPQGDAVYVPVSIRHRAFDYGALTRCPADTLTYETPTVHGQCRPQTANIDSAVTAMVYRVDTATKVWTLVALDGQGGTARANREINSLEISEDGKEMMVSMTRRASYSDFSGPTACHDETLEWISVDQSATRRVAPGTVLRTVSLPQGAACGGLVEAGATMSPSRIGTDGPHLTPAPTRASQKRVLRNPSSSRRATPRLQRP